MEPDIEKKPIYCAQHPFGFRWSRYTVRPLNDDKTKLTCIETSG